MFVPQKDDGGVGLHSELHAQVSFPRAVDLTNIDIILFVDELEVELIPNGVQVPALLAEGRVEADEPGLLGVVEVWTNV